MRLEQRAQINQATESSNWKQEEMALSAKAFEIPKQLVWKAWLAVRSNRGGAGIDSQSISDFEMRCKGNLYRIWNRVSSGSYFPPDVRGVEIPKASGGTRLLGIPTVSDRVAQAAVKMHIESRLESIFHPDSYGYRPKRSAHDAVKVTRECCWEQKWLLEFDIRAMFDTIPHELIMKAVEKHVPEEWCRLLISRWLKAGIRLPSGEREARTRGTPQGGVISPLLANLFLHYAFDMWMKRSFPGVKWCRYADDGVIHCHTKEQAEHIKSALARRLDACGLSLHEGKTHIVYTGENRRLREENTTRFTFLGFTFQLRRAKSRTGSRLFNSFLPAVSDEALKKMRLRIKWGWRVRLRSDLSLERLADLINPTVRGWIAYYGKFYRTRLESLIRSLDEALASWARRKMRRLRYRNGGAYRWLKTVRKNAPKLLAHWNLAQS